MKKTRPWMHKLPAWVERNPRVIATRERWERGEVSKYALYRIRHIVAGLCCRCNKPLFARGVCEYHYGKVRARNIKRDAKRRNAARVDKNTRAGVSVDAHSVKTCSKCGAIRKNASTCNNGVHR